MNEFKKSKTAKVVSGFVGVAMAAMMLPGVASAATVEELTAQINALLAQVAALQAQLGSGSGATTGGACAYVFTKDLKMGMTDSEVMNLQKVLNMSADTQVAASGVGSSGMETSYFGGLTKAAVIKFQNKYASEILAPVGLTAGTGFVGAATRAKLNAMCAGSTTGGSTGGDNTSGGSTTGGVVGGGVSVSLDATSPMGKTLISGQGVATLAVFKVMNMGTTPAKVTTLKLKRTGISSDSTLNNVYLYDGAGNRLTDSASVATGMITFTDSAGLMTVPAGASMSVAVRADINTGTNGQTVGVMLTDVVADVGTVSGTPVSGAEMTIAAQPAGIATADFTGVTTPTGGSIDPQNDYTVWQRTVSIGSRDTMMSAIRFQQIGSAYLDDIQNFRLYVDGVQVGSAVAKADANRFVSFNFATPVTLKAGSHVVKLVGDVVGGSGRSFQFSLRRVVDVEIWDSQLNIVVTPTVGNAAFAAVDAGSTSVNAGTITITKATDSPSGNVVLNGSAVTLAKFTVRAAGEKMKVENLAVNFTGTSTPGGKLRNGALFLDGVQIGSTADILGTTAGTVYNLGSSMQLEPGKDYVLEVRADVFNSGTGGAFLAGDTITVGIVAAASPNVYRMSSLGYISNTAVSANQVTVASGALTLSKYTAYANQTVTSPQTAYKLGEWRVTTGSTEGVNVDTFTLTLAGDLAATSTDLTNLYIVYGSKTSTVKSNAASSQTWSVNEPLAPNTTLSIALYGNLASGIAAGKFTAGTLTVSGTSQSSGQAVTSSAVAGQTITVGSGTLTTALDASTPVSALVVANSMPKLASFKYTAQNDAFTLVDVGVTVGSSAAAAAISEIVFKDGSTELKRVPMNNTAATGTALNVTVPYNSTKVIDVYAQLGGIGTGFATTSSNVGVSLVSTKYRNSNGVELYENTVRAGNPMYAFKTKPTITNVVLPTTVLANGTMAIAKVQITADAGGTVAWRKMTFKVATTSVVATNFRIYDAANESSTLAGSSAVASADANGYVTFTLTSDQEISGSKTYVVKADITGADTAGDSISTSIPELGSLLAAPNTYAVVAALAGSFIWSDESVIGHSDTTPDWTNDYLVKNLPTDSQTLTK